MTCVCGRTFLDAEDYRDHLPCPGTPQQQEIQRLTAALASAESLAASRLLDLQHTQAQVVVLMGQLDEAVNSREFRGTALPGECPELWRAKEENASLTSALAAAEERYKDVACELGNMLAMAEGVVGDPANVKRWEALRAQMTASDNVLTKHRTYPAPSPVLSPSRARLDADGTAEPLTRLVARVPAGERIVGHSKVISYELRDNTPPSLCNTRPPEEELTVGEWRRVVVRLEWAETQAVEKWGPGLRAVDDLLLRVRALAEKARK